MTDYIFSEELRNRMEKFGNMDVREAITNPDFLNELMLHAGMDLNEIKDMWKKVGRPDIADACEYED
jgi:hypothetical protein